MSHLRGHALFTQLKAGKFDVNEDLSCAMYEELVERATAAGFRQYEVANFARDGGAPASGTARTGTGISSRAGARRSIPALACQHNVNYWRGGSFYGLGPARRVTCAAGGRRTGRTHRFNCEQLEKGQRAIESSEELPPLKRAGETAAFGLRMTRAGRLKNSGAPPVSICATGGRRK